MNPIYQKKCKGCGKDFTSEGRSARFAPPEICNCLEKRAKNRNKRARERRAYARNPEHYRALTKTRSEARKSLIAYFEEHKLPLGCNSPGCQHQIEMYQTISGMQAAVAKRELLKRLECHHRDHNPFNNTLVSYPERSNLEFLCRNHHEQADRAKAGKAQIELWHEPRQPWLAFLLKLRTHTPRAFFTIPIRELYALWQG